MINVAAHQYSMNGWMNEAKADYSAAQSIQRAELSCLESANQEKVLFRCQVKVKPTHRTPRSVACLPPEPRPSKIIFPGDFFL